ncbi:hypothetical protein Pcinc_003755 [Petrolisthes cinctipes]|uniref:Exonuclease 3'-5' domain-containing protein 2 n=1 Tax=Petrolisthes cinctipes TaxID=88211 RepID=A0AAE1GIA8_PETCI|nr:hypothetical protein Pcinc_003755 [Petrolisthes cinctipes]
MVRYAAEDALVGAHLLLALSTQLWEGQSGTTPSCYPLYSALPQPPLLPLLLPLPLWHSHLATLLHHTCLPYIDRRFKNSTKQICNSFSDRAGASSVVDKNVGGESVRLKDGKERVAATRRSHPLLKSPLYDNCQLLAPDGSPLCTCDTKKAEWYIARGLGKEISRDPLVVQLTFEPKGRPEPGPGDDMYYVQERENLCVVCGAEEGLARKSIVPHEYRRYFPAILKEHASHDLLLLCPPCHQAANLYDVSLRQNLTKECQAILRHCSQSRMNIDSTLMSVRSAARALIKSRAKLPSKRIQELEEVVQYHYDSLTEATLQAAAALEVRVINEDHVPHGFAVVTMYQRQGGLVSLEHRWRSHFLATSRPRYLPKDWSPSHRHHKLHALAASLPPGHLDHTVYSALLTGSDISHNNTATSL